jgi:hypothetical protein
MPGGFLEHPQAVAQARSPRRNYGSFNAEPLVVPEAIAQTQTRARRVSVFDDAEGLHGDNSIIYNFFELRSSR